METEWMNISVTWYGMTSISLSGIFGKPTKRTVKDRSVKMAIRTIRLKGDEILTKKAKKIEVIDEKKMCIRDRCRCFT